MNKIMEQAIAIKDDIVSYRRTIHANPEVGTELPMTKKFVMDKLKEFGYEPQEICEKIGRASCRERVEISMVDVSLMKKKTS